MLLKGKVVVVTGGAGLLGQSFCRAIGREGGVTVIADISREAGTKAAETLHGEGLAADFVELDITRQESVQRLIAEVLAHHGRIDAVVNNAYPRNRNYGRKLEEVQFEDFCENVSLHLGGYFLVAQQFAAHFVKAGGGNIVNMSSIYGVMAPRFEVYEGSPMTMPIEYAAIKSAVVHLTKYFAQYYKKAGLRCNALSPGGIEDGQPSQFLENYNRHAGSKGMLRATDICGALVFLLSASSEAINGQNLVVDDGFSL
ncbi:MAG: SDR family oxidoreductase [Dechloromonas sp.]|nr:MAG: SDR family oxidoreductase [Dechloromonas sp.]